MLSSTYTLKFVTHAIVKHAGHSGEIKVKILWKTPAEPVAAPAKPVAAPPESVYKETSRETRPNKDWEKWEKPARKMSETRETRKTSGKAHAGKTTHHSPALNHHIKIWHMLFPFYKPVWNMGFTIFYGCDRNLLTKILYETRNSGKKGIFWGSSSPISSRPDPGWVCLPYLCISNIEIAKIDLSATKDGTYAGSYSTFPVSAEVSVTVKDHVITGIELLKHDRELQRSSSPARSLKRRVCRWIPCPAQLIAAWW